MKLKKSIKIVLVLVILLGVCGSFYSFNKWFFGKYNTVVNENEYEESNNKFNNIMDEENSLEDSKEQNNDEVSSDNTMNSKQRAIEEYYCSEGDVLKGTECVTKVYTDATKIQLAYEKDQSNDYLELQFEFDTLAIAYDIDETELIDILRKTCKDELNGSFRIDNYDSKKGACIITSQENNDSFSYMCKDSSYTLVGDKCVKEVTIPAKVRFGCPDGLTLDGIYCK